MPTRPKTDKRRENVNDKDIEGWTSQVVQHSADLAGYANGCRATSSAPDAGDAGGKVGAGKKVEMAEAKEETITSHQPLGNTYK